MPGSSGEKGSHAKSGFAHYGITQMMNLDTLAHINRPDLRRFLASLLFPVMEAYIVYLFSPAEQTGKDSLSVSNFLAQLGNQHDLGGGQPSFGRGGEEAAPGPKGSGLHGRLSERALNCLPVISCAGNCRQSIFRDG